MRSAAFTHASATRRQTEISWSAHSALRNTRNAGSVATPIYPPPPPPFLHRPRSPAHSLALISAVERLNESVLRRACEGRGAGHSGALLPWAVDPPSVSLIKCYFAQEMTIWPVYLGRAHSDPLVTRTLPAPSPLPRGVCAPRCTDPRKLTTRCTRGSSCHLNKHESVARHSFFYEKTKLSHGGRE